MRGPTEKPTIKVFPGESCPITRAKRALARDGADQEYLNSFLQKVMSAKDGTDALFVMSQYVRMECQ